MLDTKVIQITGTGFNVNLAVDDFLLFDDLNIGLRNHLLESPFMYFSGNITVNVDRGYRRSVRDS